MVDRADLDVDETKGKRHVAHHDVAQIACNSARLLRPRHPNHAVGHDSVTGAAQPAGEPRCIGRKQVHHVEWRFQAACDGHAGRQSADDIAVGIGRAAYKNAKARLDAELLHNGFAGIVGHRIG